MTFDSSNRGRAFKVHVEHGPTKYARHAKGLYYLNAKKRTSTHQNNGDGSE